MRARRFQHLSYLAKLLLRFSYMPKRERRLPKGQYMALQKLTRSKMAALAADRRNAVELLGGGVTRCPRHQPCDACCRWMVKGSPVTALEYGYLCARCTTPEAPEERRLIACYDNITGKGEWT